MANTRLFFDTFVLDAQDSSLTRDGVRVALSPKDCALLHYLATHRGEVIPHTRLLDAVWPNTAVSPEVLKVRVRRLRRLLGDDAKAPRFIANVHGEGYRFVPDVNGALRGSLPASLMRQYRSGYSEQPIVGRSDDLRRISDALEQASSGRRSVVLVTGEPGIGKTTLIDAFAVNLGRGIPLPTHEHIASPRSGHESAVWICRGQCTEQYGQVEPYLPIMEALGEMAGHDDGVTLKTLLYQHAPSWLRRMPALLLPSEREALANESAGLTPERTVREIAEALEALTTVPTARTVPLVVLAIEDLHWADPSTINLLTLLARRSQPARLLIVGSYRPTEIPAPHPLRSLAQELYARDSAIQIRLSSLTALDIEELLAVRFPGHCFPSSLPGALREQTGGSPLFLKSVLAMLVSTGGIVETGRWTLVSEPDALDTGILSSIHEVLSRQCDRLSIEAQRVLEAASVVGVIFPVATVAAALRTSAGSVEETCQRLAEQQQFVQPAEAEDWPDGTVTARYQFQHDIHRRWWAERVGPERSATWHGLIGSRKEAAWKERTGEIAAELAIHFEAGRDYVRAVQYRRQAGQAVLQQGAHVEAGVHLSHGMRLLSRLDPGRIRDQQELQLQIAVGTLNAVSNGYSSPETEQAFRRAQSLSRELADPAHLFASLTGLWRLFWTRAEHAAALEMGEHLLQTATNAGDPIRELVAHTMLAQTLIDQGAPARTLVHVKAAQPLYAVHWQPSLLAMFGNDPGMLCVGYAAHALQLLGYADQALGSCRDLVTFEPEKVHPLVAGGAYWGAASVHHIRGDAAAVERFAGLAKQRAEQAGNRDLLALTDIYLGWALVADRNLNDGIPHIERGLRMASETGSTVYEPTALGMLAEARMHLQEWAKAADALNRALSVAANRGSGRFDAELHRLHGVLILRSAAAGSQDRPLDDGTICDAEAAFQRALAIASRQGTMWWQLRASVSLGDLWRRTGRPNEANKVVADTLSWFTEGFDTRDLQRATTFLAETESK